MGWTIRPSYDGTLGALVRVAKAAVDVDQVRSDLTINNEAYWQERSSGFKSTRAPQLFLWRETVRSVYVPRHYRLPWKGKPGLVRDRRHNHSRDIEPVLHKITLRPGSQQEAVNSLLKTDDDKILALACGKGKTVVSLRAASDGVRFPLLIVVHTNALMDQWRERIEEFYDVDPSDIGHIQGPVCEWSGKRVVLAMLHSLAQKDYPKELYDYFRLVVFDEVHKLGAEFFQRTATLFNCERWGLSATVDREDRMDAVFRLHLGKVVFEDLEQPLRPKVYFIKTPTRVDMGRFMFRGGRVNMGALHTSLATNEDRNEFILPFMKRAVNAGRTILILGERLSQLASMHEEMVSKGFDASIHVGAMDKDERKEALKHQIVYATQMLAKEGLDRAAFDTLFILAPFGGRGRLQQSIGRILRIAEGKKDPKVFVFVDNISIMSALANRMRRSLQVMGFQAIEVGQ